MKKRVRRMAWFNDAFCIRFSHKIAARRAIFVVAFAFGWGLYRFSGGIIENAWNSSARGVVV